MKNWMWDFDTLDDQEAETSEAANISIEWCEPHKALFLTTEMYKNIRRRVDTRCVISLKKEDVKKMAELLALAAENMPD